MTVSGNNMPPQDDTDDTPVNDSYILPQVSDGYDPLQGQKHKEEDDSTWGKVFGDIQTVTFSFNVALKLPEKKNRYSKAWVIHSLGNILMIYTACANARNCEFRRGRLESLNLQSGD